MGRTRNAVYWQRYRGFESLLLRLRPPKLYAKAEHHPSSAKASSDGGTSQNYNMSTSTFNPQSLAVLKAIRDLLSPWTVLGGALFVVGLVWLLRATALRKRRKQLADAEGVPPYVIFGDATLAEMAAKMPTDEEKMMAINGVGKHKLRRFGAEFIDEIIGFMCR